jgi:hypothetical protein
MVDQIFRTVVGLASQETVAKIVQAESEAGKIGKILINRILPA